jgi:protein-S-isoprenylcysteine O-methyltransferase Ste14
MSKNDPFNVSINNWIKYSGLFLHIIGLILFISSVIKLKGFSDKNKLKQNGLYFKIRHPMYYGLILWMTGISIYNAALLTLLISIVFILNILFWRALEEKVLERKFENYKEYKKNTWF